MMNESVALMLLMVILVSSICSGKLIDNIERWRTNNKYCPKIKVTGNHVCTICYDNICEHESARIVKRCSHIYHDFCLLLWTRDKESCICPNCGMDIFHST
jgi:hypothetical protein